jgi:hypothetical protein
VICSLAPAFSAANWIVDTISAYSTGYRGLNGTVNNSLINLSSVKRLIFLDALYRGDDPAGAGRRGDATKLAGRVRMEQLEDVDDRSAAQARASRCLRMK